MSFQNDLVQKMNWGRKDSKLFWKLLDKFEKSPNNDVFKEAISGKRWKSHFQSLLQSGDDVNTLPQNTSRMGPLDYEISSEEIELGAYVLRKGKAPGYDRISYEMLSCLLNINARIFKKLFNAILRNSEILRNWNVSLISPIHKKGSKTNPNNYRGISLLSCIEKFFSAILNQRLLKFVTENALLSNTQLGFLPSNRTSDALLILNNIIDFYCNKNKSKIFGCFVDFQTAFDKVPRSTLFQKLLNYNINGKFYDCLTNMYTNDNVRVKIGDKVTNHFIRTQGVKQGCILSPLLFNIFLADLQPKLEVEENDPVYINQEEQIGCLIWADDILLLSKSHNGLNNMLKSLKTYTDDNGLTLNLDKTKVMIFNKSGRHIRKHFIFGKHKVLTTRHYKYLGFLITPSGEITSGLNDLKARAMKAFIKIRNKMGSFFQKHPLVSLKIFETLIKPILLYASDFWGTLKLPKNNPIELVHLSVCKQILGVQKQTTNIGVLLELGQVRLGIYAKNMAIKNWSRIINKVKPNTLMAKSYRYALSQNLKWPCAIKSLLTNMGMMESFNNTENDDNLHTQTFQRMYDMFHQEAFEDIKREDSKLRTYNYVKNQIGMEPYVYTIRNIKERISFTKFRLSNHTLMVEKGRHQKISKTRRFCPFCLNKIEDEIHFLLECKEFTEHRSTFFQNITNKYNGFQWLDKIGKFTTLMSDIEMVPLTAQYISETMELREFLLRKHKNHS
jgi:hypothetical protein